MHRFLAYDLCVRAGAACFRDLFLPSDAASGRLTLRTAARISLTAFERPMDFPRFRGHRV
jgi:hypothetical protein